MLVADVVKAALERLQMGIGLAVEVEANLVEVPETAVDRKIAAPVVGIALERHAFSRIDLADDVGAASERRLERSLLEFIRREGVLGKYRHEAENEGKLAVIVSGEIEAHGLLADGFGLEDFRP